MMLTVPALPGSRAAPPPLAAPERSSQRLDLAQERRDVPLPGAGVRRDGCAAMSARGRFAALVGAARLAGHRRGPGLLALVAAASLACTDRSQADTGTDTGATDEGASGTSTGAPTIDPRFFDRFRHAHAEVGYRNIDPEVFYMWAELEIRDDHTATYYSRFCGEEPGETNEWIWRYDAAAEVLRLLPNAGDRVQIGGCNAAAVELALGEACGELLVRITEPEGCADVPEFVARYLPGRICPEVFEVEGRTPNYGDSCYFEFVWCDERPLPACQAP